VPIVPAAVIFDLANGEPVSPSADDGRAALAAAMPLHQVAQGAIGAGAGATWDKFRGGSRPGGLGIAQIAIGDHLVTAFVVLNAMGAVRGLADDPRPAVLQTPVVPPGPRDATTLIAIVTSMPCDHGALGRMCVAAHDALARLVIPAHTMYDGDIAFASTLTDGPPSPEGSLRLSLATELAVEAALMRAARPAPAGGATLET
jgi:D-aminopeptidase